MRSEIKCSRKTGENSKHKRHCHAGIEQTLATLTLVALMGDFNLGCHAHSRLLKMSLVSSVLLTNFPLSLSSLLDSS